MNIQTHTGFQKGCLASGFDVCARAVNVSVWYGKKIAVDNVSLEIGSGVTALIGPSGCGKSTFLRAFNRMNDTIPTSRFEGSITINGQDIRAPSLDVVELRAMVGMVFQKPAPFPKSIFENVAYGPRIHGLANDKTELEGIVQTSLEKAALWDEVKDRLQDSGTSLSGGQQQRLCIARAIANNPEFILMDEPCSALDPIASAKIENLIEELSADYPIILVTHSMSQAGRLSQHTAFFDVGGKLDNYQPTDEFFENPATERSKGYITGRFG